MQQIRDFALRHSKLIALAVSFLVTLYIQHRNNIAQIVELKARCATLDAKLEAQYARIDAIKLDKAVFEATMRQFIAVQNDLHEIRADIRELLKGQPKQ